MTTIGYATLQIIPSLKGVSDAIEKQIEGKVVDVTIAPKVDQRSTEQAGRQAREGVEKHTKDVTIAPKVDQRAAEDAGRKTRDGVEKHTKDVTIAPKVDQRAAEDAGKKAGDAAAKGTSGSSSAVGQAIIGALQGAGEEAGRRLGEKLRDSIPTGMTGAAERIGNALRNSLPTLGKDAGVMLGTAIGVAVTDAIGKERLDRAGKAVMTGLTKAVKAANTGTDIGVAIGNTVAGGLNTASGVITTVSDKITGTIGGIGTALDAAKQLLGGDDSWAAPGLDTLNDALGKASPLLEGMNTAATLASAGAQAISTATGIASKAQLLWNAALVANPIGLIVTAIAAVVAGLVLFFTKTELGRKIWEKFTEYLKVAWAAIQAAFSTAWSAISAIWDGMVTKAGEVWQGVKSKFTAVVDFVKGLPAAISSAASGLWEGLKNGLVSVLNWIAGKWNSFADSLSFDIGDTHIGVPHMPTFRGGGYTGNVPIDQVAGVVHGGEHVIKAESTRRIENAYPGLLDYLNNNGALPLPGYQAGGLVAKAKEFAKSMDPAPYLMGGFSSSAIDCSGFVSAVANVATGRPPFSSRMSTVTEGSWLQSLGFKSGRGGSGDLRVGWWDRGGGANGHTAGTFPDGTNFESNGSDGVVIGGRTGANDGQFTQHAYLPVEAVGNPNGGSGGGSGGGSSSTDMLSALGLGTSGGGAASAAPEAATSSSTAPASAATGGGDGAGGGKFSLSVPSSLTEVGSWAGQFAGDQISGAVTDSFGGKLPKQLETAVGGLGDLGSAAGKFVDGQITSTFGVLGANGAPGWLKGVSTLVSGLSFGGGSGGGPFGGGGEGSGASAAPIAAGASSLVNAAPAAAASAIGGVHAGGGQQPGPGVTYNIRTATVEDAFLQSQRLERERSAARLSRY